MLRFAVRNEVRELFAAEMLVKFEAKQSEQDDEEMADVCEIMIRNEAAENGKHRRKHGTDHECLPESHEMECEYQWKRFDQINHVRTEPARRRRHASMEFGFNHIGEYFDARQSSQRSFVLVFSKI